MNKTKTTFALGTMGFLTLTNLLADSNHGDSSMIRPDSHAPIGVMGDHIHKAGEWMISVRSMSMKMEGHRAGEEKLSVDEVYDRGFTTAAIDMDMDMQMLGLMYAPSDKVTLMLMANYIQSDMTMVSEGGSSHGHSEMDMSSDMSMDMTHDEMSTTTMSHSTEGFGDTSLAALVDVFQTEAGKVHLNLGVSAPTGSVDEVMHGAFQPYGMQLGSGTWDAKLGATFVSKSYEHGSWGAQVSSTIRLEDEGSSGFSRADALEATIWSSWIASKNISIGGRLKYSAEGALEGHYNDTHNHSAPPHFTSNYGGDVLEGALSLNYVFQEGALRGNRIAIEASVPFYQQLNGVGMNREETITLGWQLAW
ncbi:hypothetical protein MLD52_19560 [Puniceicoccaceae bacterium K14]|nr:hypothetical protein [Puniceicoccaceae bacterium K14]